MKANFQKAATAGFAFCKGQSGFCFSKGDIRLEYVAGGTAFDTEIVDDFVLLSPPRGATVIEEVVEGIMYLTMKKNHFVELFPGNAGEGYRKFKT